jgi:BMFP domain-containing protein YqiC
VKAFHSDVKELVAQYLIGNLRSSSLSGPDAIIPSSSLPDRDAVITLPLKTVDDRWVSVVIEEKQAGYFLVHDGGKTDSELFCQGVAMDVIESFNARVATKYGVSVAGDRSIQQLCTRAELPHTILAVAEASAVMTAQLVSRLIEVETKDVEAKVAETLDLWRPDEFEIRHEMQIQGRWDRYILDFVALAKHGARNTAAINILPGNNTLRRARDYGMMLVDLRGTKEYGDWASLAFIVGATGWTDKARKIVEALASGTIEVNPETQSDVEALTLERLNAVTTPKLPLRL